MVRNPTPYSGVQPSRKCFRNINSIQIRTLSQLQIKLKLNRMKYF